MGIKKFRCTGSGTRQEDLPSNEKSRSGVMAGDMLPHQQTPQRRAVEGNEGVEIPRPDDGLAGDQQEQYAGGTCQKSRER